MNGRVDKPLLVLHGQVKTPPMSVQARRETGFLLRMLQKGQALSTPHSRPMPAVGTRVLELRVNDDGVEWRVICRVDDDAVVIVDVFRKTTPTTPKRVQENCRARLRDYDTD
jgi:phage-related protein